MSFHFPSYMSCLVSSRSPVIYSHTVIQLHSHASYTFMYSYIHTFKHTHHIHKIIHARLHFSMSKACHPETCLVVSLQFSHNFSRAKRIACNYLLSLSKVSSPACRITGCHSSCAKRIACKYICKCHPGYIKSRDVTHHVPSELLAYTFLCQANILQIPFIFSKASSPVCQITRCHPSCAKRTTCKYLLFSQECHPRYVGSRDVTPHVTSEQLAKTFYFVLVIIFFLSIQSFIYFRFLNFILISKVQGLRHCHSWPPCQLSRLVLIYEV